MKGGSAVATASSRCLIGLVTIVGTFRYERAKEAKRETLESNC